VEHCRAGEVRSLEEVLGKAAVGKRYTESQGTQFGREATRGELHAPTRQFEWVHIHIETLKYGQHVIHQLRQRDEAIGGEIKLPQEAKCATSVENDRKYMVVAHIHHFGGVRDFKVYWAQLRNHIVRHIEYSVRNE
jgi:hypothetical protein